MTQTLLLLGGSHSEVPLILAAKEMGLRVVTSGNRPDDIGHRYADAFQHCDYSVREDVLAMAESLKPAALMAGANDFAALSAAFVAERMGLPGHDSFDVSRTLHHKDRFREFSLDSGLPVPRARSAVTVEGVAQAVDEVGFPAMVKPVDLTGGKGISLVEVPSDVRSAGALALDASRAGRVIVEEFVLGSRHGATAILVGGQVRFLFTDDEHYLHNPFLVAAASTPASVPAASVQRVREIIESYAAILALVDGLFHVQFIHTTDGPVVIEVCRRAPGDLYPWLVELATGAPYCSWLIAAAAGRSLDDVSESPSRISLLRLCIMAGSRGSVATVDPGDIGPGLVTREMTWWVEGDVIDQPLTQKLGIVFIEFPDPKSLRNANARLDSIYRPIVIDRVNTAGSA